MRRTVRPSARSDAWTRSAICVSRETWRSFTSSESPFSSCRSAWARRVEGRAGARVLPLAGLEGVEQRARLAGRTRSSAPRGRRGGPRPRRGSGRRRPRASARASRDHPAPLLDLLPDEPRELRPRDREVGLPRRAVEGARLEGAGRDPVLHVELRGDPGEGEVPARQEPQVPADLVQPDDAERRHRREGERAPPRRRGRSWSRRGAREGDPSTAAPGTLPGRQPSGGTLGCASRPPEAEAPARLRPSAGRASSPLAPGSLIGCPGARSRQISFPRPAIRDTKEPLREHLHERLRHRRPRRRPRSHRLLPVGAHRQGGARAARRGRGEGSAPTATPPARRRRRPAPRRRSGARRPTELRADLEKSKKKAFEQQEAAKRLGRRAGAPRGHRQARGAARRGPRRGGPPGRSRPQASRRTSRRPRPSWPGRRPRAPGAGLARPGRRSRRRRRPRPPRPRPRRRRRSSPPRRSAPTRRRRSSPRPARSSPTLEKDAQGRPAAGSRPRSASSSCRRASSSSRTTATPS